MVIDRGAHIIQVNAADYISASYNINFPAGAAGNLGGLAIYKATATELPTAVELLATTINSVSGAPISGATITLLGKGIVVMTGAAGSVSLGDIDSLSFTLEIDPSVLFPIRSSWQGVGTGCCWRGFGENYRQGLENFWRLYRPLPGAAPQ